MTILITGATGRVGRRVVDAVLRSGERVRALTRDPENARLPVGVEVVRGDLKRPEGLAAALAGVDRLYLFPEPSTARAVVRAAVEAGVRRIVVLSSSSVLDESGDNHSGEYHRVVERAVAESGAAWTFVRPDEFAGNVLWKWGASIRTEGVVRAPYADAVRVLIHEADVGEVAAAALLEEGHEGRAYLITGPEALTQAEQVRVIGEALGRDVRFEELTHEQGRAAMLGSMPEPVVDMVLGYLAEAVHSPPRVSPVVEEVLRRPARTFKQWVEDHRSDFV
ncbi:NmrA family NAD(P)-binding protein [Nocardiopsis valliformis]|uniref:NmrA family NAD(P)-binding protein n=1 Tax=Nocardiopsis valliformis TaxID=239974 RepID=UPI000347B2CF|nr:NmrA family NAD(P)-binding protein [Nocardiopsis valliformis]